MTRCRASRAGWLPRLPGGASRRTSQAGSSRLSRRSIRCRCGRRSPVPESEPRPGPAARTTAAAIQPRRRGVPSILGGTGRAAVMQARSRGAPSISGRTWSGRHAGAEPVRSMRRVRGGECPPHVRSTTARRSSAGWWGPPTGDAELPSRQAGRDVEWLRQPMGGRASC